eukprot:m.105835 g.105835  ORF g.105835 m.105835 type:complete len:51 (+) comp9139_c9_seq13:511-663(+)
MLKDNKDGHNHTNSKTTILMAVTMNHCRVSQSHVDEGHMIMFQLENCAST